MKKLILSLILISMLSCNKEEPPVCNCGLVVSDNERDLSVVIRNDCSGNESTFYLQEGDWINAHPGSNYCITNINSW